MKSITLIFLISFGLFASSAINANPTLTQWLPYDFEEEIQFIEKTQYDLTNTTNAYKVFAADYMIGDELFVEIFAAWTKQELYNHSINVLHRSAGNVLEELEVLSIDERDYIIATYLKEDLSLEYVVTFELEHNNYDKLSLHSNWTNQGFETGQSVYHYELRFTDRERIAYFLEAMTDRIEDYASLDQDLTSFVCPKTFVKTFKCFSENIEFTIHNEQDLFMAQIIKNDEQYDLKLSHDLNKVYQVSLSIEEDQLFSLIGMENDMDIFLIKADILSATQSEILETSFQVYPNPTTDFIKIDANQEMQIRVMDAQGKVIIQEKLGQGTSAINISYLPKGNYFLSASNDQGGFTKKVIVI